MKHVDCTSGITLQQRLHTAQAVVDAQSLVNVAAAAAEIQRQWE